MYVLHSTVNCVSLTKCLQNILIFHKSLKLSPVYLGMIDRLGDLPKCKADAKVAAIAA